MTQPAPQPRRGRPPKIARDNRETQDALLHCGMRLLTEQGFLSTGIDAVLREVGVPKGSFYHYFASKEAFGRAVLERYAGYFAAKLDRCLLDASRPPLARLEAFVADARAGDAFRITHRYGSELAEPPVYEVLSEPIAGLAGVVVAVAGSTP